jgi:hypothetical protein
MACPVLLRPADQTPQAMAYSAGIGITEFGLIQETVGPARSRGRPRLEHDPEKCVAVFRKRSCSNNDLKRDDDSS